MGSIDANRIIYLSDIILKIIINKWVKYLIANPQKLFKNESERIGFRYYLSKIQKAKGFLITLFPGKAQNDSTHPSRLPDFGELNTLTRIRAIQLLTNRPVTMMLDGNHYANIFKEKLEIIQSYERRIKELAKLVGINKEFLQVKTFLHFKDLLPIAGISDDEVKDDINFYSQNLNLAYKVVEIWPEEIYDSVERLLSKNYLIKIRKQPNYEEMISNICNQFIILKAVLSKVVKAVIDKIGYQRVTILKYARTDYPRINMEMNTAPWNSTILFKRSLININTAYNAGYKTLLQDKRNYLIIGKNKYFWGFSRNKNLINNL